MKESLINQFISENRLSSYKNISEYEKNLIFSKKSYIPLSILEVSLRNSIDALLSEKVSIDWYKVDDFLTKDSKVKISQAIELLKRKKEKISKHKIIAELSFGFLVNLFKKPYEKKLRINDLKIIFLNLPPRNTKITNRETIYRALDHIRNFRNRVFHHEKVLNRDSYNLIFTEIDDLLIAMSGATTGKIDLYNKDEEAYLNQRVGLFRIENYDLRNYLFYFLSTQIEKHLGDNYRT